MAGAVPAVHVGPGDPDARALYGNPQQAGNPGHAPDAFAPQAEAIHNEQHGANVIDSQTAPARARQGFTGEDNTRAAVQGRWLFGRLFDQWAEQRLGAVDKAPAAHLTAARPPTFGEDVAGGLPSPGGRWRARGMEGVGIQPNSVRLLPRPWDEQLVNDGSAVPGIDQAAVAGSAARARGWRL